MSDLVLLVDDDADTRELVHIELSDAGLSTLPAANGEEALRLLESEAPAAMVLDLGLPDMHGRDVLAQVCTQSPSTAVVVLTGEGSVDEVVECMKLGAVDYVQKPFDPTRLVTSVRNARDQGLLRARVNDLADRLQQGEGFDRILGEAPPIRRAIDLARRAAASDVTVLLLGESGTGKELFAHALHAESARRAGPFVTVNCGGIPEGLIESELFGHEKGAFTGATGARGGRFESADGGTLFLDEIGELRTDLQVRLLRVLQERRVRRVGSDRERQVDVRVVAATNRDLKKAMAEGSFREDLYYRLAAYPIELPPLRDRPGDVPRLARAFVDRFSSRHGQQPKEPTAQAREAIERYPWPGNARELENAMERACLLEDGPEISLGSLPDAVVAALDPTVSPSPPADATADAGAPSPDRILSFEEEELRIIRNALERTGWNVSETATRLGIGRATLYRRMERLGLSREGG